MSSVLPEPGQIVIVRQRPFPAQRRRASRGVRSISPRQERVIRLIEERPTYVLAKDAPVFVLIHEMLTHS
jgi:hypothetical protein